MTTFVPTPTEVVTAYALISPEARNACESVVIAAPPPHSDTPSIVRTIELREKPFASVVRKLHVFAGLRPDWDSYGAAEITPAAIATARALLNDLALRPPAIASLVPSSIAPVATGGISIEWRRPNAALELWIDSTGAMDVVLDKRHIEPRFEEKSIQSIPAAVAEVLAFAA